MLILPHTRIGTYNGCNVCLGDITDPWAAYAVKTPQPKPRDPEEDNVYVPTHGINITKVIIKTDATGKEVWMTPDRLQEIPREVAHQLLKAYFDKCASSYMKRTIQGANELDESTLFLCFVAALPKAIPGWQSDTWKAQCLATNVEDAYKSRRSESAEPPVKTLQGDVSEDDYPSTSQHSESAEPPVKTLQGDVSEDDYPSTSQHSESAEPPVKIPRLTRGAKQTPPRRILTRNRTDTHK